MESQIIRDESGRLVPMRFSDSQEIIWSAIAPRLDLHQKVWCIVLKARQIYATTFFENLVFTRTIGAPSTNSLIIAQDLDSAGNIFQMAKRFHDHLALPKLKAPRVKEIEIPFPEGPSRFRVVSAGNIAKGRGTTQSCVHCSEVAFWPHAEVLTGLFQAIPDLPDTIWVLESTANGMTGNGAAFYNEWKAAVDGRSDLLPIFIPWFTMPKYRRDPGVDLAELDEEEKILLDEFSQYGLDTTHLAWRRTAIETKCQGSVDLFHQEYPSTPIEAFISTGLPAFDWKSVLKQEHNIRAPIKSGEMKATKFQEQSKGLINLWREPKEGHEYVIGVDTSEGLKGGDFGCAQVIDMKDLEQVGILHGLVQPWDMASQLAQLGKLFNNALIIVEVNGTGHAVQDYLIRVFNYPHLYMWRGKPDQVRVHVGKLYGWETNVYSRPLLIEAGRRAINKGLLTIHDRSTLTEIAQFTRTEEGFFEAETGHDDRVLALLLALRAREENYHEAKKAFTEGYWDDPLAGLTVTTTFKPGETSVKEFHRKGKRGQLAYDKAQQAVKHWMAH